MSEKVQNEKKESSYLLGLPTQLVLIPLNTITTKSMVHLKDVGDHTV